MRVHKQMWLVANKKGMCGTTCSRGAPTTAQDSRGRINNRREKERRKTRKKEIRLACAAANSVLPATCRYLLKWDEEQKKTTWLCCQYIHNLSNMSTTSVKKEIRPCSVFSSFSSILSSSLPFLLSLLPHHFFPSGKYALCRSESHDTS